MSAAPFVPTNPSYISSYGILQSKLNIIDCLIKHHQTSGTPFLLNILMSLRYLCHTKIQIYNMYFHIKIITPAQLSPLPEEIHRHLLLDQSIYENIKTNMDTMAGVLYDTKEEISDGNYLKMMNHLKALNELMLSVNNIQLPEFA
jgi:hypothetical protein